MQPNLKGALETTLVSSGILSSFELSNQKTLFGRRALRAVAVQSREPGTARERPIYVHQLDKGGEVVSKRYKYGDDINVTDVTFFSYDNFVSLNKRYAAIERAFTKEGKTIKGGEECIALGPGDLQTTCCVCFDKIDMSLSETIFKPTSYNREVSSWASYIMSVSSGRGLCNSCVNAGFIRDGDPVDTFGYLKPRLSDEPVCLGSVEKRVEAITAHAAKRISRLGTTYPLRDDQLASLNWYALRSNTVVVTGEDDYMGAANDSDRDVAPGERTILVAEVPGVSWSGTFRRFNCTGIIYMAAVAVDVDDNGIVIYKALTVLPSIYSRDNRDVPNSHRAQVLRVPDDQGSYALDELTAVQMINSWTYLVRDGYDYSSELGTLSEVMYSNTNEYDVRPYFLMSTYSDTRCYACHRSWRGDVGMQCSGTICPYSGRFPIHEGKVLTSALISFLTKGGPGFMPCVPSNESKRSSEGDEYLLRRATRCELSGKAFVCTNAHGGLMRPRVKVFVNSVGYNSCVSCFLRYYMSGRIDSYSPIDPDDIEEKIYSVTVTDRILYQASMSGLFSGVEVPTVFPKSSAFSFGTLNDSDSIDDMLSYISSSQGSESVLASPYVINRGGGVVECDAWDNQYGMSQETCAMSTVKPDESRMVVLPKKNKPEGLLGHLGVESSVMEFKGVKSLYTNNTRFVLRNGLSNTTYVPVVNDEVGKGVSKWLSLMPKTYILSTAHTLSHYRSALKHVLEYKKVNPTKPMIGGEVKVDSTLRDVCAELLTWGLNSSQKMFASIFIPSRFGIGGTKGNTAVRMRETDEDSAQRLVSWIIQYFKTNKDARMKPEVWRSDINSDPVGSITKLSSYDPSYMGDIRAIVSKIQMKEGLKSDIGDKNKVMDSGMTIVKRSIAKGSTFVLSRCSDSGLPSRPQRVFRDIWEENFLYVSENSDMISDDAAKFKGLGNPRLKLLPTPPFIWGEAGRSPVKKPRSFAATISQINDLLREYNMRNSGDTSTTNAYYDQLKSCYIIWDNGPVIKFPGSSIEMRWGDNLRMSTLLATRMVTSIQQGPFSELVVTLRETQTNALEIMRSERFGSS